MKRLPFLLSFLVLSAILQAQLLKIDAKRFKEDPAYRASVTHFFSLKKSSTDTAGFTHQMTYLVYPNPGIHRLPQDNMPCLVPDLSSSVAIPNLWASKVDVPFKPNPPRIPNPAKPLHLFRSYPLTTTPGTDTK